MCVCVCVCVCVYVCVCVCVCVCVQVEVEEIDTQWNSSIVPLGAATLSPDTVNLPSVFCLLPSAVVVRPDAVWIKSSKV